MPPGFSRFDTFKALIAGQRYAEAEALARETLAGDPVEPFSHFLLAHALRMQGRLSEAEAELHTALAAHPQYPEALNELGQVLAARGANADAQEAYLAAIAFRPAFFEAHFNLGIVLAAMGDPSGAIDATRKAIAIDPNRWEAHDNLARWQFESGDLDAAEEACRETIRLAPTRAEPYVHMGSIRRERHDYDTAEDWMRKAVQREPQSPEWRRALRTVIALADHENLRRVRWTRHEVSLPAVRHETPLRFNRREVPVVRVGSPQEFREITAALRGVSTRHDPVLFRGQPQDWFQENGQISLEPSRFRRAWGEEELTGDIEAWRRALRPHLQTLAESGKPVYELSQVKIRPPPVSASGSMVDLMLANPELAGTMQHYGFPTDFLDVTSDPDVAAWFALHPTTRTGDGTVRFGRHEWTADTPLDRWPTIYTLVPFRGQLVNLTDGCLARSSSLRAFRQCAWLVSFMIFHVLPLSPIAKVAPSSVQSMPLTLEEMYPDLVLALKLEATEAWRTSPMPAADEIFPRDDAIFRDLDRAGVPHLVHYEPLLDTP